MPLMTTQKRYHGQGLYIALYTVVKTVRLWHAATNDLQPFGYAVLPLPLVMSKTTKGEWVVTVKWETRRGRRGVGKKGAL